jgi:methylmalonyl-CoA mutase cobalamin-binding subunit
MTAPASLGTKPRIFLSFALEDRQLAADVAARLSSAGLDVFTTGDVESGEEYTNATRRAMTRSAAVVAVLAGVSRKREIPASILFEIGAGVGAGKPIFVVVDDPSAKLPFNVPNLQVLPTSRLDEIARRLLHEAA